MESEKLALIDAILHVQDEAQIKRLLAVVQEILRPETSTKKRLKAGWGKDLVGELPPDFDEPLDDMKEYM